MVETVEQLQAHRDGEVCGVIVGPEFYVAVCSVMMLHTGFNQTHLTKQGDSNMAYTLNNLQQNQTG